MIPNGLTVEGVAKVVAFIAGCVRDDVSSEYHLWADSIHLDTQIGAYMEVGSYYTIDKLPQTLSLGPEFLTFETELEL